MDDIFTLKGRLLDAHGHKAPNVFLAIIDEDDLDDDDLIAIGATDDEGRFEVSFLTSEFRQDTLEFEDTPDIKIVVSAMIGDTRKAVFARSFPDLDWNWSGGGEVDLGDITLTGVDLKAPTALEGVEAIPGFDRRAVRLEIDDELVSACLAEVAPIVEKLTGWPNLLDDLKIEVVDSLAPFMIKDHLAHEGIDPESLEADILEFVTEYSMQAGAGTAMYDAHTHTMLVQRQVAEQSSLEGFKLVCGHELVHVGQHKYTPGLKAYGRAQQLWSTANPDKVHTEEGRKRMAYMTQIEGYASYIELEFLNKQYYRMALLSYKDTFCQRMLRALFSASSGEVDQNREAKASQYVNGLDYYIKRQNGSLPARFDLDVASLFGGAEFVD